MIGLFAAAILAVGAVVVELILPGRAVYHTGWYNVLLIGLVAVAAAVSRKRYRAARAVRGRLGVVALVVGAATAGVAGAASGLLGPDSQTIVGSPGQRVRIEGLGVLAFSLSTAAPDSARVTLERDLHAQLSVGVRATYTGGFILRMLPRTVAYVEARDERGNRLTITQPQGAAFLSPVLLMQHRQRIVGLDLPFDSFNVPAARRVVKAVLFTPQQAALLAHGQMPLGESAVLFAVDDENDRLLPHAIALSVGGRSVRAGGLSLRATVASYPAVEVVSSPNLLATAAGILLVLGGIVALVA